MPIGEELTREGLPGDLLSTDNSYMVVSAERKELGLQ